MLRLILVSISAIALLASCIPSGPIRRDDCPHSYYLELERPWQAVQRDVLARLETIGWGEPVDINEELRPGGQGVCIRPYLSESERNGFLIDIIPTPTGCRLTVYPDDRYWAGKARLWVTDRLYIHSADEVVP